MGSLAVFTVALGRVEQAGEELRVTKEGKGWLQVRHTHSGPRAEGGGSLAGFESVR